MKDAIKILKTGIGKWKMLFSLEKQTSQILKRQSYIEKVTSKMKQKVG